MNSYFNGHSFRQVMLMFFSITLFVLAISYVISMHYIFTTSISRHMEGMWQKQTDTIAERARFSIVTESKNDIRKIIKILQNPLIINVSVFSHDQLLYSTGRQIACDKKSNTYWCLSSDVTNINSNDVIGVVRIIVSKAEIQRLINENLIRTILAISFITLVIYGFSYHLTNKLIKPIQSLSSVMQGVSDNERGLRVNVGGPLDIQELQLSFNSMIMKIEKHEHNLEQTVKERTLKLSEAYKRAQSASQAKMDILKITSHEMKTPLHNALYYLQLMKTRDVDFTSEIFEDLEQLQYQIVSLLDYAQAEDNKIKLNSAIISPKELLESVEKEHYPILSKNDNQLFTECNYDGKVYSDGQLIKQILNNLLSNANKCTQQGTITVRCDTSDNNHLTFSVKDTGCGIAEHNLENIFNPFWQVDMSSTRHHQGTGLGLSICQLFAETINGHITVESKLNQGTLFTLSLPIKTG